MNSNSCSTVYLLYIIYITDCVVQSTSEAQAIFNSNTIIVTLYVLRYKTIVSEQ